METSETPPPRDRGVGRLLVVAAVGAGAVLGFQSLTSGSNRPANSHPGRPAGGVTAAGAATGAAQGATGAASAAHAPGGSAKSVGGAAAIRTAPVAGPPLVVVIDEPKGPFAQQNRLIMQGATVALAKWNAAGGAAHHGVRLISERLDGLSPAAVQARLRAAGRGAVLVLPCDSDSQFTIAAGAARYKTLMLAPCNADAAVASKISTYWPVGMPGNAEAAGLAGFIQRVGYSNVYVVNSTGSAYGSVMTRYFQQAVQAKHLRVAGSATVSMALTDAEIKRVVAGVEAAGPRTRMVFSALPPPVVDRLAAGLARAGLHEILLGTSAMDTPLTLSKGSSALENATFATYGFTRQDPAGDDFLRAYRARFGLPSGGFPGLGFETIRLLEAAVAKARSTDPSAIGAALSTGITLTGVALADRSYTAGANHNPVSQVSVEKVAGGGFLPLLTVAPTDTPAA